MNTATIKNYAPKARRAFIQAVTDRAAFFGLTARKTEPITEQGDVAIIGGKAFPRSVADKRKRLEERIERQGFAQTMEAAAYTWFNRLVAIRYMELHGYLGHGYRVLSHPESDATTPEILQQAEHVELPGLNRDEVIELKLDGGKESELYRKLLIAQCNALHKAMPFLFERVDDETELLLPDNLLHSDSLVRTLVASIDESDWQQVEIIGWLYQFYISEKKDQVIGKTVKSEDIPAATQLFTPNWIVKYMVQNALGAQWLATYPDSPLKSQMDYYIEPAEQTPDVQAQLDAITPKTLDPEALTLIDPACGSGHILVEAYDLFKAIYLERGYRLRDIPEKILRHNLFGLEIDPRATQLAGFALMMKARHDDPRIFTRGDASTGGAPWMNVRCIVSSDGIDAEAVYEALAGEEVDEESGSELSFMEEIRAPLLAEARREKRAAKGGVDPSGGGFSVSDLKVLLSLFSGEQAQTFGSLIQIPDALAKKLPALVERADRVRHGGDLNRSELADRFFAIAEQAQMLASRYDAVVANPPYMGGGFMCKPLKAFVASEYKSGKGDLFTCFINRGSAFSVPGGNFSVVTMHTWMFLRDFESFRSQLISGSIVRSLAHLGNGVMGISFATSAANFTKVESQDYIGTYSVVERQDVLRGTTVPLVDVANYARPLCRFDRIPGQVLAYRLNDSQVALFEKHSPVSDSVAAREGMTTADNERFLRFFWEVDVATIEKEAADGEGLPKGKWFPYQKGGPAKRWFGNNEWVVDWANDGRAVRNNADRKTGRIRSHNYNGEYALREGITWSSFTNGGLSFRHVPRGYLFDSTGSMAFPKNRLFSYLALLNSKSASELLSIISPSPRIKIESLLALPDVSAFSRESEVVVKRCVELARDIDSWSEISPYFISYGLLSKRQALPLEACYTTWITQNRDTVAEMKQLEEENNRLFIEAYGLQEELSPEVPIEQITLTVNPAYRYGIKLSEAEREERFRQDTMRELVSYAVGCMMGRYSLDAPGIIYAHAGGEGFDPSRYTTFAADEDGIIPLTDTEWFEDDATARLIEFIGKAWPSKGLEANLNFLAENLDPKKSPKKNEGSRETLRRYLSDGFYKDHVQTYKKRPIYWLFSSGKQKAFQALVYLHRYNPGTLSRMRTEYVIPLQGKMAARLQQLEGDRDGATSTSHRNRIQKELDTLSKRQDELRIFDEKLRHYADQRIALDLDDGVKVNYARLADLLAEVKAVCGKTGGDD